MISLHLSEIAGLTSGRLLGGDVVVDGPVVTDSREVAAGSLYVARVGEHADGHDYVDAARAAGAVAVLGSSQVGDCPTVVVDDVQTAFGRLARGVVERCPRLAVIGITGSSGKTSTKDLMAAVLSPHGPTVAPVGSYNSEIGVPLTVCRVDADTRYLVAEMGADGPGHISYLTDVAPPRIGVVLNVGRAHVGAFGSADAIADTKAAMVEALPAEGLAVLNADDPRVRAMAERTRARVCLVGTAEDADLRAVDVRLDELGRAAFTARSTAGDLEVTLGLLGEHHVGNALAVLATARELGLDDERVAASLRAARPVSRWRMELHELPQGISLVNDAYNANPDSMRAALAALARMGATGRRTIAVLGAMRELGEESDAAHQEVGRRAVEHGVHRLVVVGDSAAGIRTGALAAGAADDAVDLVPDTDAAHALLQGLLRPDDVVLLKSSRDSGLRYLGDRVVAELTTEESQ